MPELLRRYASIPPVVKALLISNGLMFVMELSYGEQLIEWLALWPLDLSSTSPFSPDYPRFWPGQLVSYAFLHGGVMHLLLNMYALWLFGSRMENAWGSRVFAVYYFVSVIGAGLVQLLVTSLAIDSGGVYPTIGASGGVFGVLLAFGITFPNEILLLVFPPVALKAKWFVLIFGMVELWFGVTGTLAGVAHFAHLGGMLFGYILIVYWRAHPPGRI